MNAKEAQEFINFALGFRTAAYGASTIVSSNSDFLAGQKAGRAIYPARESIPAEVVLAAYEKWKGEGE